MAKLRVWVATWRVRSKEEAVIDVPDEDIEGLEGRALDDVLLDYAESKLPDLYEWGYELLD